MVRADRCRVRVWCEDPRQEQFVRELFRRFGFDRRSVRVKHAPDGRGSASQWVITRYSEEVIRQARATRNQANLGFLVMVDGDNQGVVARKKTLCGVPDQRAPGERIAICVPTWSIETWLLWLCGETGIREDTSYKRQVAEEDCRRLVKEAVDAWESIREDEDESVPSLAAARSEVIRLPGVQ